jgi:hypothetical protein
MPEPATPPPLFDALELSGFSAAGAEIAAWRGGPILLTDGSVSK